jgi:putative ABC transport system permease protein
MAIRAALVWEVVVMALDTVRTNKMRSALTILGVVIGITSIVGMTALIRGFDQSLRELIEQSGPDIVYLQRMSISGMGPSFIRELLKRPDLTVSDARALEQQATTLEYVDLELGAGPGPTTMRKVFYRDLKTKTMIVFGTGENWAEGTKIPFLLGRYFSGTDVQYRKNVCVLGNTAYKLLFEPSGADPIGKMVRIGTEKFEVVGVFDKRASPGGIFNPDDFVVVPYTTYSRVFGLKVGRFGRGNIGGAITNIMISVRPRDGVSRDDAMADVERVMRIRHGLKLDQPNDFDLSTSDSFLKLWDSISQGTFFALVVISSIALMVGGIGVMAIMSISVTERTREIGVRKALGARRAEILFQFLMEAAFLTSLGGVIGIGLGAGIGYLVHVVSGFPISLPWWSFAIGIGFSASVGIFFGSYPAFKASRLDPIEALRYE